MLTTNVQTKLRQTAEVIAGNLYSHVARERLMQEPGLETSENIERQNFLTQEVLAAMSQRARRDEVDNDQRLRERYK